MKITKVSIIVENVDEENASVRLVTDPIPSEDDEIEDTPAVLLGSMIWEAVQEAIEYNGMEQESGAITLQ